MWGSNTTHGKKRKMSEIPKHEKRDAFNVKVDVTMLKNPEGEYSMFGKAYVSVGEDDPIEEEIIVHNINANDINPEDYINSLLQSMAERSPSSKNFGS